MSVQPQMAQPPGLSIGDIYYILFRHKWKVLICSATGIITALVLYQTEVPPYQSEAKLLVRYIITDSKATNPQGGATSRIAADERGQSIMTTETEILNSADLATQVADAIGPERILARYGGGKELGAASAQIRANLRVHVPQASNVIHVSYRHRDTELVRPMLKAIIDQYLKSHLEAHRAAGMLGDSLSAEADTLRARLAQTEDDLRRETGRAGVISLEQSKEAYSNQLTAIRREIFNYEAELAGRLAVFEDIKKRTSKSADPTSPRSEVEDVSPVIIEEYRALVSRLGRLQSLEQDLILQYTPENIRVVEVKSQRAEAENAMKKLRETNPGLVRPLSVTGLQVERNPEADEAANAWLPITSYQAKIKELSNQELRIRAEAAKLDQVEGNILALRRKKDLDEVNYRFYAASLEQSRISQTLGNGKVSNISLIQTPSPTFREAVNLRKLGLVGVGGILVGLGWAFLIELYFDRSVRRPTDLQKLFRAPLFLSIPMLKLENGRAPRSRQLASPSDASHSNGKNSGEVAITIFPGKSDQLRPFHETLRDRLIGYFDNKNLTHKPKLVAVTGLNDNAGVTTTAAGLARSLSETGEGNVLLVDMTLGQGAAQQFTKGAPVCDLDEVLEARSQAHVSENLYVVTESSNSERLSRNLPQRFTRLIPKLKASEFDYIIFDMPPVSQLSITPRLAGFMDMVLLIVESERTNRDVVQGAYSMLADSKAHVGVVLNKTRSYVPSSLHQELINN